MKSPLISIILPTKNAAVHLEVLFKSLIDQTFKDFEVIINEDKDTSDNTAKLIKKYQKKLDVKYIHNNVSMAQGRKAGAEVSRGKYQLHLDADMKLSPKVLKACLNTIKRYDALIIPEISYGEGFWSKVKVFERGMYVGDDMMESARFVKASVYKKIGGHNEKMVLSEDKDFHLRIKKSGYKIGRIKEPIYHNEGRLSLKRDLQKKYFYGKTAQVFISENPKHAFKQANLIFRGAYFKNWKKLLSQPILASGMFFMKGLETVAAFFGLVSTIHIKFTERTLEPLKEFKPLKQQKTQKGLISIIVPTLNASRHLKTLLPSLVKQTYKKFEVIINDDKKTNDDTEEIVAKYSKNLKINYIKENTSMAQGRKSASMHAKGEFMLHLDADMKLSPKVLKQCMDNTNDYDALVVPEISYGKGFWARVKIFERSMYVGDDTVESARFFSSSVYRSVGGHNEKMVLSEDKDIDLRIRKEGYRVGRITAPIYHNEGNVKLFNDLKKKYFYGRTASVLMLTNPAYSLKYGNIVFRPAFFRNWRKMLVHPVLSIGVFTLKLLHTVAGFLGMLTAGGKLIKDDVKVNIWK